MRGRLTLLALLAVIAVALIVPAGAATSTPCWQRLVRDWSDGRIDGSYPVSCYRAALQKLPEDLQVYSSAPDDIKAALERKLLRSSTRGSRGLAVAGKQQATGASAEAGGASLGRPTVLAAALGAFGFVLALVGALAGRRRSR